MKFPDCITTPSHTPDGTGLGRASNLRMTDITKEKILFLVLEKVRKDKTRAPDACLPQGDGALVVFTG